MTDSFKPQSGQPERCKTHFVRKPAKCPKCGHRPLADIWYGSYDFTYELKAKLNSGTVVLGGCCIDPENDPVWACSTCDWQGWRSTAQHSDRRQRLPAMNPKLLRTSLDRVGRIEPAGCESTVVSHPNPEIEESQAVQVGFVMEHRFAFCHWIKSQQDLLYDVRTRIRIPENEFRAPDLVSWDWHDDCGADDDVIEDELKLLNLRNEEEVALYAWAGLHPLNDGHMLPAVWLNALGNVYIIQKQKTDCKSENRTFQDRFGREHSIFYFRSHGDFAKTFEKTNSGTGVIWDIDLDYFTKSKSLRDVCYASPVEAEEIQEMLEPSNPWMPLILEDLKAVTIALEPKYTGGLSVSLELYRHWESALFTAPLFSKKCRWKKGLVNA